MRLLRHLGVDVDFPEGQTCCGQPAFNAGHAAEARRMARHTLDVFAEPSYVVLPSGAAPACSARFYPELLPDADRERARDLAERTWELSQFLVRVLGVDRLGAGSGRAPRGLPPRLPRAPRAGRPRRARGAPPGRGRGGGGVGGRPGVLRLRGPLLVKLPEVSAAMADRKLDTLPRWTA